MTASVSIGGPARAGRGLAVGFGWLQAAWQAFLRQELRRLILWLPVLMGLGISLYLGWRDEPPVVALLLPLPPVLALAVPGIRRNGALRALALAVLALTAGHALAQLSAVRAAMPAITHPFAATAEGRVIALDLAASGAPRVLLDRVTLFGRALRRTPPRVRVTLTADTWADAPRPGAWIRVYATLLTPRPPVEPGGFDFARRAYFDRLGAIGFSREPAVAVPVAEIAGPRALADPPGLLARASVGLVALRHRLADAIREAMPAASGAFAAAILVGERSAIGEEDAEALRISSLAHLLAISGLHMGMLTGLVFATVRAGLSLSGGAVRRWPAHKIAAVAALLAGLVYLGLSGATVATQRAFVMVLVAFTCVLMDRPAITLRAVAAAAVIVLALRPISLFDPGFQMSFAATTALVAAFAAWRDWRLSRERPDEPGDGRRRRRGWPGRPVVRWAAALVASSLIAGLATAPVTAVQFHRLAPYGLLANLLAVPAMGLWIVPLGAIAALLAPLGAAAPVLSAMGWGIDWVLAVAHEVAALPGADRRIAAAPSWALGALMTAGLWLCLWRGPLRLAGVAVLGLGLAVWSSVPATRPAVLIAQHGRLVGVLTPDGRALTRATGQSYAAERWLARDGDGASQSTAAARFPVSDDIPLEGPAGPWRLAIVRAPGDDDCQASVILVAPRLRARPQGPCVFIGSDLLSAGAVSVTLTRDGPVVRSSAPMDRRPWHPSGQR
ncbi:MAG: ComEC/Rec2 family competence protein [Pseudomonadota bacterium]